MESITKLLIPVHLVRYEEWAKIKAHLETLSFDGVEWRLDALENFDVGAIKEAVDAFHHDFPNKKMMLTLRTEGEHEVHDYLEKVASLLSIGDYVDIEYRQVQQQRAWLDSHVATAKAEVVLSYHAFEDKGEAVRDILEAMAAYPVQHLKVAMTYDTHEKQEQLLQETLYAIHTYSQTITALAMGTQGGWTRLVAPSLHEGFAFAALGSCCTQYGQPTADQMWHYIEQARKKDQDGKEEENC